MNPRLTVPPRDSDLNPAEVEAFRVLEDFTATEIAPGVVSVRYVSRSAAGVESKPPALRSSLWCHRGGRWQLLLHQGTRLPSADG